MIGAVEVYFGGYKETSGKVCGRVQKRVEDVGCM